MKGTILQIDRQEAYDIFKDQLTYEEIDYFTDYYLGEIYSCKVESWGGIENWALEKEDCRFISIGSDFLHLLRSDIQEVLNDDSPDDYLIEIEETITKLIDAVESNEYLSSFSDIRLCTTISANQYK